MKFCHVRLEYRGVADSATIKLRLLQGLSRLLCELNEAIRLKLFTFFVLAIFANSNLCF